MESRKQLRLILSVIILALLFYVAVQVFSENDEARIRRVVNLCILAVEKEDTPGYSRFISQSYQDSYGNTKAGLLVILADNFKEYKPFKVDVKQLSIKTEESKGQAGIAFKCYFKRMGDKQIYYDAGKAKIYFQKEEKSWKVTNIEYKGSSEMLFLPTVA